MNIVLGLIIGALIGWAAFALLRLNVQRGVLTSLVLGSVGGGFGMYVASMLASAPRVADVLDVFGLVVAAATATACIITAGMIESR